ncbi:phosphatidylinositol-glycan biosynthesis class X protein [Halyomorpha halys]|uniref:phosphatidylinositol-glycan biosynthesis class X protein n=1 Tax=Halyomorpha halys TaxID=286706 RepID=UPI0006D50171|nr:phosphatidylinositol-glycan biosynthesis class X protein [Halyomorpha halys]
MRFWTVWFLALFSEECMSSPPECSLQAYMNRKIDSLGFHRNIYYNISLETSCEIDQCKLCIQEMLPSGTFVNTDQLRDLSRTQKLLASVDGNVDIESPASISSQLIVRILSNLNVLKEQQFIGTSILPVHTRYQDPQAGGGFKTVNIHKPELYIYCPGEYSQVKGEVFLTPCAGDNNTPLPFSKVAYSISGDDAVLKIDVPVGNSDNLLLVQMVTVFVTIIGSVYITGVILKV